MKPSWLSTAFLTAALSLSLAPVIVFGANSTASTQGECSQAFSQVVVNGSLTINSNCANYREALQSIAERLEALRRENKLNDPQMRATVEASNIMISAVLKQIGGVAITVSENNERLRNLEKIIDERLPKSGTAPERIVADAQQWQERYDKLLEQWKQVSGEGDLDKQARQALLDLDLDKAGSILDRLLQQSEPMEKAAALRHYRRAEVFRLQFRSLDALPHYQKAHALDPDNVDFAFAYANLLQQQNDFREAERVYLPLLASLRKLAAGHPATYRRAVAATLNNLGVVYRNTQRFKDAQAAFGEALAIRRELARTNPVAYGPDLATTLNNMGIVYRHTQRFKEAEAAYGEALDIDRALARDNPAAYRRNLAAALNDLGVLYVDMQRFKEAQAAYGEALDIFRALARDNPAAYRRDLAATLNNLGIVYQLTQRFKDAEAAFGEALDIDRELARDNPAAYRPVLAATLNNLGVVYRHTQRLKDAEAAFGEARDIYRALARDNPAAYRPDLTETLMNLANLYRSEQRVKEAEALEGEAGTLATK